MRRTWSSLPALVLAATCLVWAGRAGAAAGLIDIRYSPDITVDFNAAPNDILNDEDVASDDLAAGVTELAIGAIPATADVTAYHFIDAGSTLLALDTTVALAGLPAPGIATPGDVVVYNGATYSYAFRAATAGIPAGVAVDAVSVDALGALLLSFDVSVDIDPTAAVVVADDEDVVRHLGGTAFAIALDGSAATISASLDLDALHYLPALQDFLVSFDTSGTLGGISFDDEDVLQYDPSDGSWEMVYDGSAPAPVGHGWAGADLDALDVVADSDNDAIEDDLDNCAAVSNPLQENLDADLPGNVCDACPTIVNSGSDPDLDGIDQVCDTCLGVANFFSGSLTNRTLVSGTLDDDGDGRGNLCDFDTDNTGLINITPGDFNNARASQGKSLSSTLCGTGGNERCYEYDFDGTGTINVTPGDFNLARAAQGKALTLFPRCATCVPPFSRAIGDAGGSPTVGRPVCVQNGTAVTANVCGF